MKLKGKTIYHMTTGADLGVVTKANAYHAWVGSKKFPREEVAVVKRSKRARKGKAPDAKRLAKKQRREDKDIPLSQDLLDIPEFLRQREPHDPNTENNIQFRSYGCRLGTKMWHTSSRFFLGVKPAKKYLKKFIHKEKLDFSGDEKRKRYARLRPSNRGISSNYSLDLVLKGKEPKGLLPNIIPEGDRKLRMPKLSPKRQTRSKQTMAKSSDVVVLKQLCRDLGDLDPRKARIKLRKTVGNTDGRWAWEVGSKELEKVKSILSGNDDKKKKRDLKPGPPVRVKKKKKSRKKK